MKISQMHTAMQLRCRSCSRYSSSSWWPLLVSSEHNNPSTLYFYMFYCLLVIHGASLVSWSGQDWGHPNVDWPRIWNLLSCHCVELWYVLVILLCLHSACLCFSFPGDFGYSYEHWDYKVWWGEILAFYKLVCICFVEHTKLHNLAYTKFYKGMLLFWVIFVCSTIGAGSTSVATTPTPAVQREQISCLQSFILRMQH